jgi:hypothetical protein
MHPLNREAGATRVPRRPGELEASVRAAKVMWRAYPYLWFRYGARGARFALSDAAFLMTLVDEPASAAAAQVLWMAKVLACRGMPSLLLEQQLRTLHKIARRTLPPEARYAALGRAAKVLTDRRARFVGSRRLASLSRAFAEQAGHPDDRRMVGLGALLVCAVVDELCGAPEAVDAIAAWLVGLPVADARFVTAVRTTIEAARRACTRRANTTRASASA